MRELSIRAAYGPARPLRGRSRLCDDDASYEPDTPSSPKMFCSSTITSPTLMPMRNRIRRPAVRSARPRWISTAQHPQHSRIPLSSDISRLALEKENHLLRTYSTWIES